MPTLQTFTSRTRAAGPISVQRATAAPSGGLQIAGDALLAIADKLDAREERKAGLHREETIATDRLKWTKRVEELKRTLPNGGEGIAEQLSTEMTEYFTTTAETMGTTTAQEDYTLQSTRLQADFMARAVGVNAAATARGERRSLQTVFDSNRNSVVADPSMAESVIDQNTNLINQSRLPTDIKNTLLDEQTEGIWASAADGMLSPDSVRNSADAEFQLKLLQEPEWQERLSPQVYARALDKAEGLVEQYRNIEEKEFVADFNENMRETRAGVAEPQITEDEIDANVSDPADAAKLKENLAQSVEIGETVRQVAGASLEDIQSQRTEIQKALETPGEFDFDVQKQQAFSNAVELHFKRLTEDSAGYAVTTRQSVRAAVDAYALDPTPDTLDDMVAAQVAAQTDMGLDPRDVNLLSNTMIGALQAEVRGATTEEDAPQRIFDTIQDLQNRFGAHWPMVERQLQTEKVFTDTELVVAGMNRPDQLAASQDLLVAANLDDKTLKSTVPNFETVRNEIRAATINQTTDLTRTLFVGIAGGEEAAAKHLNAVNDLAMLYVSRGDSVDNAVSRAAELVIMGNYDFSENFRVPVSAGVALGSVENTAASVLTNLSFADVVIPQSLNPGITEDERRAQYSTNVKATGRWVTNGDETGLVLIDETGSPVTRTDGNIIELLWEGVVTGALPRDILGEAGP